MCKISIIFYITWNIWSIFCHMKCFRHLLSHVKFQAFFLLTCARFQSFTTSHEIFQAFSISSDPPVIWALSSCAIWMRMWDLRPSFRANALQQTAHWYGRSPVWVFSCRRKSCGRVNVLKQTWHLFGSPCIFTSNGHPSRKGTIWTLEFSFTSSNDTFSIFAVVSIFTPLCRSSKLLSGVGTALFS